MEECNDNKSIVNTDCKTIPSPKLKPKKRSLVERELETSLTTRITSPISNNETVNTSRYGRARKLKNNVLITTDRKIESPLPIHNIEKSPNGGLCAYKMYASNSPTKPQSIKHGLDNQIENIYNQNIALSRFNSDEKIENLSKSKIYMRKDLIQTRDKEETIILIKNMFSPNKNLPQAEITLSSEKSSKNHKRDLSSVVKTLDFDGKKKKEGQVKRMSQSDLFELEAQCEYQVGDLAWARMGSYPFWPSLVTREPSSNLFIKKKLYGKLEKDMIHVTFFGDNGRRGWILMSMLRKYLGLQEFETARENFTSEAKRKDYRLYAAFFVTGKRLPLWHLSVEEAEILVKEPKRLRIDILNTMLTKGKEHKSIPAKSKKVTRTDSDISLSESLYDSLFSEDDYKGSDTESGRNKTRKKSFDVSEVVTACLDNMAVKTGITKIQKQSHMDIWLQKAKSKTPEKCQFKQLKLEKKVKTISKSCNESNDSMEYMQTHEKEHDYFTRSANTNEYFDDEIVDSGSDLNNPANNESIGAYESCICEKDMLGISPDTLEENLTEIEVITNEDIIVDGFYINDPIFNVDQRNHVEELQNIENLELSEVNKKPMLEQSNFNNKFSLIDTINDRKDHVKEKCVKENNVDKHRVENFICIHTKKLLKAKNGISISKKNFVSNKGNNKLFSNNYEDFNVSKSSDFNQMEYQTPISNEKTLIVIDENQSDTNLSKLDSNDSEFITNNMKLYSINLESDNVVQDGIVCNKDNKTESKLLVIDKKINTNVEMNTKIINEKLRNKEECTKESVEYTEIQEKQCKHNYTTSEQNNLDGNIDKSKAINHFIERDIVTESSNQSDNLKFFSEDSCDMRLIYDSSSSDSITTTLENNVTNIKCAGAVAAKLNLSHDGEVHKNAELINGASNIQKECADVPLSSEQGTETKAIHVCIQKETNVKMSKEEQKNKSSNQHDNIKLQDKDSSDFELTYDLDKEYNSSSEKDLDLIPSTTGENNSLGCQHKKILPFVESECNKFQNNECDVDQSKFCNVSWATNNESENNDKDIIDVAKFKETMDHFSGKENGLKNAEFLKYVEQKQDIIMDENPDLTYEEVTAYLLKTWHYERSLKSDKKVSNIVEATTDKGDHHTLESIKKNKTRGKTDKFKQTLIDFIELQNNEKDVCMLSKPKRDAENSNLPYHLAEENNPKKCDNSKTKEVSASLRHSKKNIGDLLPHNNFIIGRNEQSSKEEKNIITNRTYDQQIINSKNDVIKISITPENTEFNKDENQIPKPSTPISYLDLSLESDSDDSSDAKKFPKLILSLHKKFTKQHMDSKNDSESTRNSEEKKVECETLSENKDIRKEVKLNNVTAVNVLPHSSEIVPICIDDTETSLTKSENNYSELTESNAMQNENKVSKTRFSLRLKLNVLMSDTDSDSAKSQIIGDFNELVIDKENSNIKKPGERVLFMATPDNLPELTESCECDSSVKLSPCKDLQDVKSENTLNKARLSNTPPSEGLSKKKQSKIDDFIKRTKDLNSSFNSGTDKDSEANCSKIKPISKNSCDRNDLSPVTPNLKETERTLSKRQVRKETLTTKGMDLENPEFLEYLELRLDQLIDEHPELTLEEITTYIYNTWFFEESIKSENKRTDDLEQRSLVKGLAHDPVGVKKGRKKVDVDKENDFTSEIEVPVKEKTKRRAERQFYREDFSDFEDELDIYQIYKSTLERETKDEQGTSKNNIKELLPGDLETTYVVNDTTVVEEDIAEKFDQVEEYFRKLTEPKPNLFKGLVREKVCEVCEKAGDLIKCKGCHSFFHANCSRKGVEIKGSPISVRGRKKKRKNRGRKPKCLDDSYEDHSDKSQEHDMSFDHETESHTIANADEFEEKLSVKLREMIENPDIKYDTNSSEEELEWSDAEIGACKIVEIIPKKKKQESIDFKCADCEENSVPICFVCKRAISIKKQIVHRQKCQVAQCYKYYHIDCLEHWPQTQYTTGEKKGKEFVESLQCPRHVCHTCVCDDPRGCKTRFSGDKLARCVRCPATYHTFTKCLPAGTQILSGSHIICPRHYEHRPGKVPCHVNTGWCFICALGGTLICCEYCPTSFHAECLNIEPPEGGYMCEDCETGCLPLYGEMVWVKLGHYRWWPGLILHPSEIPENILAVKHAPGEFVVRFFGQYDHYWVNRGRVFPFQEGDTGRVSSRNSKIDAAFSMAVEHAQRAYGILKNESPSNEGDEDIASSLLPPHYVKLKVNKPCGSLINKKIDIEESSLTQCECDPKVEDPCGLYSHCLNRMLLTECGPICRAGERCCNRAFEKRQYPRMEPYRTPARGWGLRTLEDIRAGQFIIEYVGELIDEVEFQRRMKWKHQVRDENYYFLTLDKERMIDAGPKGNLARFMNHSCDPNCETQKWTVLGDVRVGLFALYDIPAKSELTFNYNLECAGIEKKRCMCGTARCSGFMGAKPKQEEPKKNKVKRSYKKRKRIELSPTNEQPKPKRRQPKNRELTEIEKDLLIIKNATNGISSDSESSGRHNSIESIKRRRNENNSPSTKKVKIEKKKIDKLDPTLVSPQCERIVVNQKSFDVD